MLTGETVDRHSFGSTFLSQLGTEALASSAVNHPYLEAISEGDFPNIELAFKDFAFQYGLYSAQFIRYLSAVIANLSDPKHQQILQSNLDEEKGHIHDIELPADVLASIDGQPHARLFRRFQEALNIDVEYHTTISEQQPGQLWGQKFLQLCEMDAPVGVGAIGIGTEQVVSKIYNQILTGLKAHSNLSMIQRVFFDLHSQCDDEHAAQLMLIAEDLAVDQHACEQIGYGVNAALKIRKEFWDAMLERAMNFPSSISPATELSALNG